MYGNRKQEAIEQWQRTKIPPLRPVEAVAKEDGCQRGAVLAWADEKAGDRSVDMAVCGERWWRGN